MKGCIDSYYHLFIESNGHSTQLRGMGSTLHMRTAISPGQWRCHKIEGSGVENVAASTLDSRAFGFLAAQSLGHTQKEKSSKVENLAAMDSCFVLVRTSSAGGGGGGEKVGARGVKNHPCQELITCPCGHQCTVQQHPINISRIISVN